MTLLEKTPNLLPDVFSGFFDDDRFMNFDFRRTWPTKIPAANVFEHDGDYKIELAVPGMRKKDFNVTLDNRVLTISAEHEEKEMEDTDSFTRREFNYSSFRRSFNIPENVDLEHVVAKYEAGVLNLTLPKLEMAKKLPQKEIQIM